MGSRVVANANTAISGSTWKGQLLLNKFRLCVIDPFFAHCGMDQYTVCLSLAVKEVAGADLQVEIIGGHTGLMDEGGRKEALRMGIPVFNVFRGMRMHSAILGKLSMLGPSLCRLLGLLGTRRYQGVNLQVICPGLFYLTLAIFVRFIAGVKPVVTIHDLARIDRGGKPASPLMLRMIYRMSKVVHVHTAEVALQLSGFNMKRVVCLPHGNYMRIVQRVDSKVARKELGIPPSGKVLVFFGQLKRAKGLQYICDLAKRLPGTGHTLVIAGRSTGEASWFDEEMIRISNAPEISYISEYINARTRDLIFSCADFVLMPYLQIYQSGVMNMAHSYGVRVAASDIPFFRDNVLSGDLLFSHDRYVDAVMEVLVQSGQSKRRVLHDDGWRVTALGIYRWVIKRSFGGVV